MGIYEPEDLDPEEAFKALLPSCTVLFDKNAGIGVDVLPGVRLEAPSVDLRFVTARHAVMTHTLTMGQAEQLRAALDVITQLSPSAHNNQSEASAHRRASESGPGADPLAA